ncbi:hypothetical protein CRUP_008281 [Coryphaenoides rupestris]|nr:hypothetical protein CRUP_008281 [Coryphaenoides rupestris]
MAVDRCQLRSQSARFPKDKVKRRAWKAALRRRDFEPNDCSAVCSCHFNPEDFDRTGQTTRLKEGVIPSVFAFPGHPCKVPSISRPSRTSLQSEGPEVQLSEDPVESTLVPMITRLYDRSQPVHKSACFIFF